ncbi:MAG TPA: TetR/AcrR family transcriptional regulator [Terrimicrobiaceae bacterium]
MKPKSLQVSDPSAQETAPAPYHHGALREALLVAAEEILLERGVEGFTLRNCARRAGVSHAAPAHHFGDVKGLLTEFAAIGFDRMTALMRQYVVTANRDGGMPLHALGRAYIDFAMLHRAHFQLMFRYDLLDHTNAHLSEAGGAAYAELESVIEAADPGGSGNETRRLLVWSAVHGFATLLLEGKLDAFYGHKDRKRIAQEAGDALLGMLTNPSQSERSAA